MSDIELLKADNDYLVDAIDHIKRVCHSSRTQSRRIRWIASRCESALNGDDEWRALSLPKTVSSDSSRFIAANRQLKLHQDEITRLRNEVERKDRLIKIAYEEVKVYEDYNNALSHLLEALEAK